MPPRLPAHAPRLKVETPNGARSVAAILNSLPPGQAAEALASMEAQDPDLAAQVRGLIFTFEDFLSLDLRSLREILRQAPSTDLLPALRAASTELREKIFSTLAKRAADTLREDLEAHGPVRLTEAEEAQKRLTDLAHRLESQGVVVLAKGKGEVFI